MKGKFPVLMTCVGLLLSLNAAHADQIVKPHTFTAGTPANADEVNANFDTVYDQVNTIGAAITVDAVNNVGIGTVTPVGELHVTKPQVMSAVAFSGAGANDIAINDSGYSGTGTSAYKVMVHDSGPAVDVIQYSSDDGATWSEPVDMVASGLDIGFGVTIGFSSLDGHASEDKWEWSVSQGFADGLIVSDGTVTVKNIAITTGASAGRVLTSDTKGNASWQATPVDNDMDSGNEINESFTLTGTLLEIEDNGGLLEVDLGSLVNDADADPNNEFQVLSRIGTNIYLTPVGGTVSIADNDNDSANELQTIGRAGTDVMLSNNGGTVSIADNDNDSTNELITSFTMGSGVLQLSDAAGTRFVDFSEKLSINSLTDAKTDITSLFLGNGAGNVDDGGNYNVVVGPSAMAANTSGFYNVALGYEAMKANITGAGNTANGYHALLTNISGEFNTANGYFTLANNTTGNFNTALGGRYALASNTIGSYNTAIGTNALYLNSTSGKNTALGMSALSSQSYNNSGTAWDSHNTAVGFEALYANKPTATTNGIFNTAVGSLALRANTIGDRNTAGGYGALTANTTGFGNTAIGNSALQSNISGGANTAVGTAALTNNTTGDLNTALGRYTLMNNTTGNTITALGSSADVTANNLSNATAIGYGAQVNASNKVRIGNASVGVIEGQVGWSALSDERDKKDIQDIGFGMDFIRSLKPVEYKLKEGNDRIDFGFIAQDIEELLGTDYNVLGIGEDAERKLSLRYTDFIAPMVKAMQEQQEIIESQQAQIAALIKRIEALEKK